MAEIKNREQTALPRNTAPTAPAPRKREPAVKRRRVIRLTALVLALALLAGGVYYFTRRGKGSTDEVLTDVVQYGAITAAVEGSGLTRAKTSESISIATPGTMVDVMVTEGQQVTKGTPLFTADSPEARNAVDQARTALEGIEKQIAAMQKDLAGLNLTPGYAGKLTEVEKLNPGDPISKGQKVATLSDDSQLRLTQYYSYAYAGKLKAGQSVQVSLPALMTTLTGKVETVHMVSRITPEGAKLFSADILVRNPGSLTADMAATATVQLGSETVYPYEQGKLEYFRTGDLCAGASGTVISSGLVNYLQVQPGQVLVRINGEDSESEMFTLRQSAETARKELETAQKNLDNCKAVAPIDGTVIGLTIKPGDKIDPQNPILTISDTSTLTVNAAVNERNVGFVKAGMPVELTQQDTTVSGVVESVSLSSTVNNGVVSFPLVISADNTLGSLQVNGNVSYSLIASQNDNCLILPIQCVRTVADQDGNAVTVVYIKGQRPDNTVEVPYTDEEIPEGYWPVPVEVGIQDNINVEIRSGVEEGTEVFTQVQSTEIWS